MRTHLALVFGLGLGVISSMGMAAESPGIVAVEHVADSAYLDASPDAAASQVGAPSIFLDDMTLTWQDADLLSYPSKILIHGNVAYCTFHHGIATFDVSDAAHPVKLGELILSSAGSSLALYGDLLYVSSGWYGDPARIISVADPSAPGMIKALTGFESMSDFTVHGTYLYAIYSTDHSFIRIYDLADPLNPVLAATLDVVSPRGNEIVTDMTIADGYLYLTTNTTSSLLIADVAVPTAPALVGSVPTGANGRSVAVSGNLACAAMTDSGMYVFDITNRVAPVHVGTVSSLQAWFRFVYMDGTDAYIISPADGLQKFDLSNPASPVRVGLWAPFQFPNPYGFGWTDVALKDGLALLLRSEVGLEALDFSVGYYPAVAGTYEANDYSKDVVVTGDYAYVASWRMGLRIMGLATPSNPQLVGSYRCDNATRVAATGNTVFLGQGIENRYDIIDVTDPNNPMLISSLPTLGQVTDLAVHGTYLYLTELTQGLHIFDISNAQSPVEISGLLLPGAVHIGIGDTLAVVSRGMEGCAFVSIADPANPAQIGSWSQWPWTCGAGTTDDHYAYVLAEKFNIFDLSKPGHPLVNTPTYNTSDVVQAKLQGNYLWITGSTSLAAYNITNQSGPSIAGSTNTRSRSDGLDIRGDYVYAASETALSTFAYSKCCQGGTGDINANGVVDLVDLSSLVYFVLYSGWSGTLPCGPAMNVNVNGIVDLSDLSMMIAYLTGERTSLPACP